MLFAALECQLGDMRGVFEGDDGLMCFSTGRLPPDSFFADLGFSVKMVRHERIEEASFCGIVFDGVDKNNLTDPRDFLAGLGWAARQYRGARKGKLLGLLRAKALSALHQYPGCPVVCVAARRIVDLTQGVDHRWVLKSASVSQWEREQLKAAFDSKLPDKEIGLGSRLLIEKVFNVTVSEQLAWEAEILSKGLEPWTIDLGVELWYQTWQRYVVRMGSAGHIPIFPARVDERRPGLEGCIDMRW